MSEDGPPTTDDDPDEETIGHAHGAGASQMRDLIQERILPRFDGESPGDGVGLAALDDGAVLPLGDGQSLVVTTDSHVVSPQFFPGGDIGRLSVSGTVNDLAVMGATRPVSLTCSFIVEEGFPLSRFDRVLQSMEATCEEADCAIHTGDTKVMGSGDVDGIAINTAAVGVVPDGEYVADAGLSPGDEIIVSGTVGDHGISLLSYREEFDFKGDLESDVAPINGMIEAAMDAGEVTAMKDPTRGGLATSLNEMVDKAGVGAVIDERSIPVTGSVASAGEVLGIEPMDVANEGKVVMGVATEDAKTVLNAIREHPMGENAAIVGEAVDEEIGRVVLDTGIGRRYLSEPSGEPLPRIC
ncbi:MAG: hydrogenase expression/formation protein HypE [Halobacteriales archaeon]|jgi:hydrogenase expression/formation protein HypE